jgi:hypothetical protein
LTEAIRRWAASGEDSGLEDLAGWVFADLVAQDLNPEPYYCAAPPPKAPPMQIPVIRGRI